MEALGSALVAPHVWAATAAVVVAALLVVLGALDGAGQVHARAWLDRLVIALAVLTLVAVMLGPGILIGVGPPASPLHFLFAAIAVLTVPAMRLEAERRRSGRVGWWVAAGGLVTLGALLGLWTSGV